MTIIIELDVEKQTKNISTFFFFSQLTYPLADVLFHARPVKSKNYGIVGFLNSTMSTKRACVEFHKYIVRLVR